MYFFSIYGKTLLINYSLSLIYKIDVDRIFCISLDFKNKAFTPDCDSKSISFE